MLAERTLLPTAYCGPVDYYSWLVNTPVALEAYGHYERQTFANRCRIMTAGGPLDLSIPVEKPASDTPMKEVRIAWNTDWATLHFRAIESAYSSSPYFMYFREELLALYQSHPTHLMAWNNLLQNKILSWLAFEELDIVSTDHYEKGGNLKNDMRSCLHPKKKCVPLHAHCMEAYHQVFQQRFGFVERLSILDMVFNIGREARLYLLENNKIINNKTNNYDK